ncbi:hypothetical protein CBR_g47055 [Chara braunii]|uniref:Uncharacterized protein n=1 Tax=Chara braunii TaxID=69332 RepID=A0A388M197_CHABU|nr:hypothetical protein CBR_g47055 [Chara braunii]|eukprot:GBG88357.1 hypothetical protein CBR_g47055 [Chara braunii]
MVTGDEVGSQLRDENQDVEDDVNQEERDLGDRGSAKSLGNKERSKDTVPGENSGKSGESKRGTPGAKEVRDRESPAHQQPEGAEPKKVRLTDTRRKLAEVKRRTTEYRAKLLEEIMSDAEKNVADDRTRQEEEPDLGQGSQDGDAQHRRDRTRDTRDTPTRKGKEEMEPPREDRDRPVNPPLLDSGASRPSASPAYLFGRRFILRIDPTNVVGALKNYKPIDPTVGRWVGSIWQFDYKIERIAGLRNRAHGLSRVALTPEGLEEAEPIDAFLDYEGGTLVADSEMAGTTCTIGELFIKALEKGPPAVVAELREGTVTRIGRREEKDAWGSVVKPRDEQIALAIEEGWRRVMSMMESQELEMQHCQAYKVDNNQTGTQEEEQFFLIKSYEEIKSEEREQVTRNGQAYDALGNSAARILPPRFLDRRVKVSMPSRGGVYNPVMDWAGVELVEDTVYLVVELEWRARGRYSPTMAARRVCTNRRDMHLQPPMETGGG